MSVRNISGKAKCGLLRSGKRVMLTLEFPTEMDAMLAFDTWSAEDFEISYKGPKVLQEIEDGKEFWREIKP